MGKRVRITLCNIKTKRSLRDIHESPASLSLFLSLSISHSAVKKKRLQEKLINTFYISHNFHLQQSSLHDYKAVTRRKLVRKDIRYWQQTIPIN